MRAGGAFGPRLHLALPHSPDMSSSSFDFSAASVAELARADARRALDEDVGSGDLTAALVPAGKRAVARVITRENAVLCGAPWVEAVLQQIAPQDRKSVV